jgi:hypothetical protein
MSVELPTDDLGQCPGLTDFLFPQFCILLFIIRYSMLAIPFVRILPKNRPDTTKNHDFNRKMSITRYSLPIVVFFLLKQLK